MITDATTQLGAPRRAMPPDTAPSMAPLQNAAAFDAARAASTHTSQPARALPSPAPNLNMDQPGVERPVVMTQDPQPQATAEQARAAAFARAKDAAGQQARASIDALHNSMAARGIGGGLVARGEANVIGQGATNLSDFNRKQYQADLGAAAEGGNARYELGQQQRAQNQALAASMMSLLNGPLY